MTAAPSASRRAPPRTGLFLLLVLAPLAGCADPQQGLVPAAEVVASESGTAGALGNATDEALGQVLPGPWGADDWFTMTVNATTDGAAVSAWWPMSAEVIVSRARNVAPLVCAGATCSPQVSDPFVPPGKLVVLELSPRVVAGDPGMLRHWSLFIFRQHDGQLSLADYVDDGRWVYRYTSATGANVEEASGPAMRPRFWSLFPSGYDGYSAPFQAGESLGLVFAAAADGPLTVEMAWRALAEDPFGTSQRPSADHAAFVAQRSRASVALPAFGRAPGYDYDYYYGDVSSASHWEMWSDGAALERRPVLSLFPAGRQWNQAMASALPVDSGWSWAEGYVGGTLTGSFKAQLLFHGEPLDISRAMTQVAYFGDYPDFRFAAEGLGPSSATYDFTLTASGDYSYVGVLYQAVGAPMKDLLGVPYNRYSWP